MDQPNLSGGLHSKLSFVFPTRHCSLVFPKSLLPSPHIMAYREIPKVKSDSRIRQKYICDTAELTADLKSKSGKTCSTHSKRDSRTGQLKRFVFVLRRQVWKDRARAQRQEQTHVLATLKTSLRFTRIVQTHLLGIMKTDHACKQDRESEQDAHRLLF